MQRFYRASTAGTVEGTGFGLAISREIVERHQGRVEVESEEGIGSTFRVRPPLQDGAVRGSP
jgi:signal transduction histidine kinase